MTAFPSEAAVVFSDYQQLVALDLNDVATLQQATTDNVSLDFLTGDQCYSGLGVSANADAKGVTVATGRLYSLGGGYALRAPANIDLTDQINAVPDTVQSLVVLIVANSGTSQPTETRTLEDASAKPDNPADLWATVQQIITTRRVRSCTASFVPGVPAVVPQAPAYNPLLCLLATVTLNKTGVVSVVQSTAAQITRLDQIAPLVTKQGAALAAAQALIAGLLNTVSGLATLYSRLANDEAQLTALAAKLSALENRTVAATTMGSVLTVTDTYTDTSGLTVGDGTGYGVGAGLTFPNANKTPVAGFAPLNPADPNIALINGRYLTAPFTLAQVGYCNQATLSQGGGGMFTLNKSGPWNATLVKSGFGVARTRYGAPYQYQATTGLLASGDPTRLFGVNVGDLVYDPTWADWKSANPELVHGNGLWKDNTGRGYWTPKTADGATSATSTVSQVIRTPYDVMQMGFKVQTPGGGAGLRLLVCEDLNGLPNPNAVLVDCVSTVNGGYINWSYPAPLLRRANKDYHYVIIGNQPVDFYMIGTNDGKAPCRQFLYLDSFGNWIQHAYNMACWGMEMQFTYGAPIEISGLLLAGGISNIDVLTPVLLPDGGDLNYGIIFSGQTAYNRLKPIDASNPASNLLAGNPSQLRFFLEISGTAGTAPVIDLGTSATGSVQSVAAKRSAALTAESAVRTPSAPVTKVTRAVTIVGFNPALHTYAETLETGANYATLKGPDTAGAPVVQADGTTLLTFAWTITTGAVPSFKLKYAGTTQDATQSFRVTQSITTASP